MFSYHGGMLWVDFINTEFLQQGHVQDQIRHLRDFADWLRQAGEPAWIDQIESLLERTTAAEAEQLLADLRRLRKEARALADEVAATETVSEERIADMNELLALIEGSWRIMRTEDGHRAVYWPQPNLTDLLQWPILQSVMEFLTEKDRERLKPCRNHACIQYFYDISKNNTRRWCRMEVCGNREKARRHYRKKAAEGQSAT
jgi:predicted RNA-binding Zn ribbon-like protein